MRRRKFLEDFITYLTRYPTSVDQQHLISLNIIENEMKKKLEDFVERPSKESEIGKLEMAAIVKMSYIMLYEAYKKKNPGREIDENEKFEKQEVIDIAHEMEDKAEEDYNKRKKKNPRELNEYSYLRVRKRAPIEDVNNAYIKRLRELNEILDRKIQNRSFSESDIIRYKTLFLTMQEAHRNLSNAEYKLKLDEILLLNFNPDQSQLYVPRNFADITYFPEKKYIKGENGELHEPEIIAHNSAGDEILIIQTGDLGFGRFRKPDGDVTYRDPYFLKEYKLIKIYSDAELSEQRKRMAKKDGSKTKWNDAINGEEFNICGNLDVDLLTKAETDIEYKRYTADVLLSTVNMDEAIEHNGGYIGKVYVGKDTGEYIVHYDRDALCLAREFQRFSEENSGFDKTKGVCIRLDKRKKRESQEER